MRQCFSKYLTVMVNKFLRISHHGMLAKFQQDNNKTLKVHVSFLKLVSKRLHKLA